MKKFIFVLVVAQLMGGAALAVAQQQEPRRTTPNLSKEEWQRHNAKVREARLKRTRGMISKQGQVTIKVTPYIAPSPIPALSKRADLVIEGVVSGLSPVFERVGQPYFNVTVQIERVIRSKVAPPSGEITFAKSGGTLVFREGSATWVEEGDLPFRKGERYVLFFVFDEDEGWGLFERYGQVKIQDNKVVPQTDTQEAYTDIDVEEFIRRVQTY